MIGFIIIFSALVGCAIYIAYDIKKGNSSHKKVKKKNNINLKKRIIKISIFTILLIFIAILGVSVFNFIKINNTYNTAVQNLNNKKYKSAIKGFSDVKDYKDSKKLLQKTYYEYGKSELSKNNYDNAINQFKKCKKYKDSKTQIKESYYQYAKLAISNKHYDSAIRLLNNCKKYKDTENILKETLYNYGVKLYNENNKDLAIDIFREIDDYKNYKDVKNYTAEADFKSDIIGTWKQVDSEDRIVFKMNSEFTYYSRGGSVKYEFDYKCEYSNFEFLCHDNYVTDPAYFSHLSIENGKLKYSFVSNQGGYVTYYYDKVGTGTSTPKGFEIYEPKIGMTEEEVLNSSWGSPSDKNKYTYSWGTREQWVYGSINNRRYIYFKNGKVTSISE